MARREIVGSDTCPTLKEAQDRGDAIINAALLKYQKTAGKDVTVKREDFFREEKSSSDGNYRVTVFYEPLN